MAPNNSTKEKTAPRPDTLWWGLNVSPKTANLVYLVVLICILAIGIFIGRESVTNTSINQTVSNDEGAVKIKRGPWGDLEYFPIMIEAPKELLKVEGIEETPVKWFFKRFTRNDVSRLFDNLNIPASQRDQLLSPGSLGVYAQGLTISPPREVLYDLKPAAFEGIYRVLAGMNENGNSRWEILSKDVDLYGKMGISEKTISLLKKLSAPYGKYLVCYCMPYVLSAIEGYEEKANLIKALTTQHTMLIKLHITPQTDINALASYWGKAFWTTDVKAILESIKELPKGGRLDILELLPPLPTSLLYTYPLPENPMNGTPVIRNCSWAAFNFFRDPPDPKFSDANYVVEKLKSEYYPIESDPHFGDVMILLTPNDELLHTAVYLADGIVYTKNGDNPLHPWMFSTITDLIDFFSISLSPGQNLSVQYYRNKYY